MTDWVRCRLGSGFAEEIFWNRLRIQYQTTQREVLQRTESTVNASTHT
jgi:hypothetical protein